MALDKLVDSAQLDSDLASVANAIRAKSGGVGQLAFPAGFVSEIGNISGGGGITPTGTKEITITENGTTTENVTNYANAQITVNVPTTSDLATLNELASGSLKVWFAKGLTYLNTLRNTALTTIVFPDITGLNSSGGTNLNSNTSLTTVDFGAGLPSIPAGMFNADSKFNTLVLRKTSVVPLNNTGAFNGTLFASGKAGGTIYIPKALYDHLGDGTADDYQSAGRWSTVHGYGTITWAQIEGSQYENAYADGTSIA